MANDNFQDESFLGMIVSCYSTTLSAEIRYSQAMLTVCLDNKSCDYENCRDLLAARVDETVKLLWVDPAAVGEVEPFDVLVSGRPTPDLLAASPTMSRFVIPWAGIPAKVAELLPAYPDVTLHNLHYNAAPVAEYAVTLLLAAAKAIVPFDAALRQGDWGPRYQPAQPVMLSGGTALVVGYGAIGKLVARQCAGLGMTVHALRRSAETVHHDGVATIHPNGALHALLPQTDALMLCLPLTPETERLFGSAELDRLPATATIVNIGRGKLIDEQPLYDALRERRIHAAGLDVWYNYPKSKASRSNTAPANLPFGELDNVVMTPHCSSSLRDSADHRLWADSLANLLNQFSVGNFGIDRVDLQRGY